MTVASKTLPKYVFGVPGRPNVGIPDIRALKRMDRTRAGCKLDEHVHHARSLELIYLARGRQTYVVNQQRYTLSGGDVLMICPGDSHSSGGTPQEKGLTYWIEMLLPPSGDTFLGLAGKPARALLDALHDLISRPGARHFMGTPSLQKHLDSILYELVYNRDRLRPVRIHSHLMMFLSLVLACAARRVARKPDPRTARVLAFIETRLHEQITLDEIARRFGVSKTWLVVQFTRHIGMPPMEYILRRKVELAGKELADRPQRRIIDIAMDLGFSSSQNFATAFRRYTGMSPQESRALSSGAA